MIDGQVSPASQPLTATNIAKATANATPKASATGTSRGTCRRASPSAARTAAPARRDVVSTSCARARSTSIVAPSADIATTAPLAAKESAGVAVPAKGMAARMAAAPASAAASGQTISATRKSGP